MSSFSVTRVTVVAASLDVVLAKVGDVREWPGWFPWAEGLTDLKRTYGGPERAVGAHMHWTGDPRAGEGHLEITEHSPTRVSADLTFDTPYRATNQTTFELTPRDDGVEVAWTMSGDRSPVTAIVGHRVMDRELAAHLERGLALLRGVCEA